MKRETRGSSLLLTFSRGCDGEKICHTIANPYREYQYDLINMCGDVPR